MPNLPVKLKPRARLVFRLKNPGPRRPLYGAVPKVAVVTGANAVGSKYGCVLSCPPRMRTLETSWFANCELPGAPIVFRALSDLFFLSRALL